MCSAILFSIYDVSDILIKPSCLIIDFNSLTLSLISVVNLITSLSIYSLSKIVFAIMAISLYSGLLKVSIKRMYNRLINSISLALEIFLFLDLFYWLLS